MSFPFLSPFFFFFFFPWLSSFSTSQCSHPSLTHSLLGLLLKTFPWSLTLEASSPSFTTTKLQTFPPLSTWPDLPLTLRYRVPHPYARPRPRISRYPLHATKPSWTQPLLVNQGPARRQSPPYLVCIVISFFFFFSFLLYGYWILDFGFLIMDFGFWISLRGLWILMLNWRLMLHFRMKVWRWFWIWSRVKSKEKKKEKKIKMKKTRPDPEWKGKEKKKKKKKKKKT